MLPVYVVVVDSDPRFLEIATRFLQKREGTLVYSAVSTGDEVLKQTDVFEPDVILYNLGNSSPESLDTIKQLRDRFPGMTIIVISPPENEAYKQDVLDAGANDMVLRQAMNLEFLPAIWSLVSIYQHRYGRSGIRTIPGTNPLNVPPPSPKMRGQAVLTH